MGNGPETRRGADRAMLSIGALSRATAISIGTLRTWERRYGYPVPARRPSGHRVYPAHSVARLRLIAEALARGHRAREVVTASDTVLAELLRATATHAHAAGGVRPATADANGAGVLRAVVRFDADGVTRPLLAEWARLGPLDFLEQRVAPLIREVGEAWATGRLQISHEHFLSERVGALLRTLRTPFEDRAEGPLLVLATLPGEAHALGLQMAALLASVHGCRTCYVGTEVPLGEIATVAHELRAHAVGISVSSASAGRRSRQQLGHLREALGGRTRLVVGGEGAPAARPGLTVCRRLEALHTWVRGLGRGRAG